MRGARSWMIAAGLLASALLGAAQEVSPGAGAKISLGGLWKWKAAAGTPADLYLPSLDDQTWKDMRLPANWHLAGENLEGAVWFRRRFRVSAGPPDQEAQLVFEGIDYAADVWLNGDYLGFHQGYFEPFRFMVSAKLNYAGDNVLAVLVHSPNEEYGTVWSLHKTLIKGVFGQHDTRPGGAWSPRGQEQNTGGIWAPVYLRFSRQAAIEDVQAVSVPADTSVPLADGEDWQVPVQLAVFCSAANEGTVQVDLAIDPLNFLPDGRSGGTESASVRLQSGENLFRLEVRAANVRLWSSWDRGRPNLYRLRIQLLADGVLLDESEQPLGFRTISVDPATQQWILNGKHIFLLGTNYISTQWLSEMTAEKYGFDLMLMKRANINSVRVHAHIEAPEFYRACDEAGVLVWQDFALQWGYSEDSEFEREAVRQALAMVRVLGGHPAVIGWTMHNEPPWDAPWMQYKYTDYDPQQNKRLDDLLYQAVSDADPTRYTHQHSATAEHPWLGWYSGAWQDYGKPTREPFITEFGAQALPDMPSLLKIFAPGDLWPDTPEKWELWDYHNFEKHETFDIAKVPMGSSIEELIANTQQYQATVTQFAAESYRRQRFHPVTAIFQFMFVEDWPSVNWGILDYWRNPKPGYYALATAYQRVLPSVASSRDRWKRGEKVTLDLWITNDTLDDLSGSQLVLRLQSPDGHADEQALQVNLAADSNQKVMTVSWKQLPPGAYRLSLQLQDAKQEVLGSNLFTFEVEE